MLAGCGGLGVNYTDRKSIVFFINSYSVNLYCWFQCMLSLQSSHLPESAEILDILNQIEFEGLFYSHDKLAQLQVLQRREF
jgi:hypothetical protein